MKKILVIGGAGYIGSHMVNYLQGQGLYHPVVFDDLSYGHRQSVKNAEFIEGCIGNKKLLDDTLTQHKFDCVMHFASYIQVGESVENPAIYYENNVSRTINLLNSMVENKVDNFIFSSTAAIFGNPEYTPIDEDHPKSPINPYGKTKLMVEQLLEDYKKAYGLNYGVLRYFNAAGAAINGGIGECHSPETHLIPLVLQAASGRRENIRIFGTDYDTGDGSCIRDYIHVDDLSDAHMKLMEYICNGGRERFFNLGTGTGYSVLEVIKTSEKVTGNEIPVIVDGRREGDPPILVANGRKAGKILGWVPKYSDLETIIKHAWQWEKTLKKNAPCFFN